MDEITSEFLTESHENLGQLDHDLVELEKDPRSAELLASVFRTFHTMKGVAGFLNFAKLEAVAHAAEDLLSRLRDGELILNPAITSTLLAAVDAVRQMLAAVESSGTDGEGDYAEVIAKLKAEASGGGEPGADKPESGEPEKPEPARPAGASCASSSAPNGPPFSHGLSQAPPETENHQAQAGAIANGDGSKEGRNGELRGQQPAASASGAEGRAAQRVPSGEPAPSSAAEGTIRVNVHLLDKLMNLVGELVLTRNQILQFSSNRQESAFLGTCQRLNLITTELQEGIMKTRMQPIGNIWSKFPRIVRDLALTCGKRVRIEMEGEETELDKTLIEAIRDPLTHIVRNSIDHGIETPEVRMAAGKPAEGKLCLRALHESGQVIIEVADDGAGIDLERVRAKALECGLLSSEQAARMGEAEILRLIFKEGFSTKETVTNISGRGVGMDVVKTNIEKIGGTVDIYSRRGQGTTLRIKIPLTLAIIPALIVTCAGERYAIPQISLIELVRLEAGEKTRRIELICGSPVYRLRGRLLPVVYLHQVLKLAGVDAAANPASGDDAAHIVVLQVGDKQFGLVVDEVNDTAEIVVKPLGRQLKGLSGFAGATIMGDGRVALILDVVGLASLAAVATESREAARAETLHGAAGDRRQRLLICRAGGSKRLAVPLDLVARLEEFPRSRVEHAGEAPVVQYRDSILPLVALDTMLGASASSDAKDSIQVVVFDDGSRRVGVVVDELIDIVEEEVTAVEFTNHQGLLGSAIVGGNVTDFLNLREAIAESGGNLGAPRASGQAPPRTLLLVDASAFERTMVRSYLKTAGHQVMEASSFQEAADKLMRSKVDLAMAALSRAEQDSALELLRERAADAGVPLVGLVDDGQCAESQRACFDDLQPKFGHQAVLSSIEKLLARRATVSAEAPRAQA